MASHPAGGGTLTNSLSVATLKHARPGKRSSWPHFTPHALTTEEIAAIDDLSRRILAWRVNEAFEPDVTEELLIEAGAEKLAAAPDLLVDGGVDGLVVRGLLRRLLAMVDISSSNSLIERTWRSLEIECVRHLFLHRPIRVLEVRHRR